MDIIIITGCGGMILRASATTLMQLLTVAGPSVSLRHLQECCRRSRDQVRAYCLGFSVNRSGYDLRLRGDVTGSAYLLQSSPEEPLFQFNQAQHQLCLCVKICPTGSPLTVYTTERHWTARGKDRTAIVLPSLSIFHQGSKTKIHLPASRFYHQPQL